jgi:hypothetical protein
MFANELMGLPVGLYGNDDFFKQTDFLNVLNIALIYALSHGICPEL